MFGHSVKVGFRSILRRNMFLTYPHNVKTTVIASDNQLDWKKH
nr:hypothetical protein [Mucilaginibacter sp. FT3.2]